jgi:hypothetical protein
VWYSRRDIGVGGGTRDRTDDSGFRVWVCRDSRDSVTVGSGRGCTCDSRFCGSWGSGLCCAMACGRSTLCRVGGSSVGGSSGEAA